jgi:hypothetical protein
MCVCVCVRFNIVFGTIVAAYVVVYSVKYIMRNLRNVSLRDFGAELSCHVQRFYVLCVDLSTRVLRARRIFIKNRTPFVCQQRLISNELAPWGSRASLPIPPPHPGGLHRIHKLGPVLKRPFSSTMPPVKRAVHTSAPRVQSITAVEEHFYLR